MNKSESIVKITAALSKFQMEVKNPPNSSNNPFFKSKYAPLDVVINTAKESLGKYGLSYIQMPGGDGASVSCTTILMCEGEWIESDVLVLKADKTTAQGAGSAITYARRYQLSAMLGLAGEEDDDGNHATGNKFKKEPMTIVEEKDLDTVIHVITKDEAKNLLTIADKAGVTAAQVTVHLLAKFKLSLPSQLNKEQYNVMCKGYENMKKVAK